MQLRAVPPRTRPPRAALRALACHPAVRATVLRCVAAVGLALVLSVALFGRPAGAYPPAGSATAVTEPSGPGGQRVAGRGVVTAPAPGVPVPPGVTAKSYVVADAGTGDVLAAKDAHVRALPASTLKALTALALEPVLDPDRVVVATRADADIEGSKVGLVAGSTYTVRELLHALFLRSGNDAASALAAAAGGQAATADAMNDVARRLGAADTVAVNPSGLDAPAQLTSAYDLALIGRAVVQSPTLRAYSTASRLPFPAEVPPAGQPRGHFEVQNKQPFMRYPGAIGVKNGYTKRAGGTLIAAAQRGDRTLIVTLLGSTSSVAEEAAALADWGFAHPPRLTPVGELVAPEPPVAAGSPVDETAVVATAATAASLSGWLPTAVSTPVLAVVTLVPVAAGALLLARVRTRTRRSRRRRRALGGSQLGQSRRYAAPRRY